VGPDRPNKTKAKDKDKKKGALEIPNQAARDRLALQFDPSLGSFRNQGEAQKVEGNSDRLKIAPGETPDKSNDGGTAPKQGLTMADLVPPVGVLARLSGGPANDALGNVEEGEGTFLKSREFKYASFFNRLKRSVSQHWKPLAEVQRRDPTGNIYGYRTRVTVLTITLNADGTLQDVQVKQSSGVDFLDKEALAAFQRAEPFPNPPKGLIDSTGHIVFPFGFHIDFSGHGGFGAPPP
jgi:TonB family protein